MSCDEFSAFRRPKSSQTESSRSASFIKNSLLSLSTRIILTVFSQMMYCWLLLAPPSMTAHPNYCRMRGSQFRWLYGYLNTSAEWLWASRLSWIHEMAWEWLAVCLPCESQKTWEQQGAHDALPPPQKKKMFNHFQQYFGALCLYCYLFPQKHAKKMHLWSPSCWDFAGFPSLSCCLRKPLSSSCPGRHSLPLDPPW